MIQFLCCILFLVYLFSCSEEPNYPITPSIEFSSIRTTNFPALKADSITITLSFRDGDGDLGLSTSTKQPPLTVNEYVRTIAMQQRILAQVISLITCFDIIISLKYLEKRHQVMKKYIFQIVLLSMGDFLN